MKIKILKADGSDIEYYLDKEDGRYHRNHVTKDDERIADQFFLVDFSKDITSLQNDLKNKEKDLKENWNLIASSCLLNFLENNNEIEKGSIELEELLDSRLTRKYLKLVKEKYKHMIVKNSLLNNTMIVFDELDKITFNRKH